MRETIAVTRFNQATWNENCRWREKHNIKGCIYGTLQPICEKIHDNYKIYVLEMNNDTNTIEGIGIISNKKYPRQKIYSTNAYNRMIYKGTQRIDRSQYSKETLNFIYSLENLVFKGASHMKRGSGINILPVNRKLSSIESALIQYTEQIILLLATEYNFNAEESIKNYMYPISKISQDLILIRNKAPDKWIIEYIKDMFINQMLLDH
tara:strand:- start:7851 stop:8474 length:624 start_codon:yes stop_codon:yes gene_type:complete